MLTRITNNKLLKYIKQWCPTIVHNLSPGRRHLYDFFTEIYIEPLAATRNGTPILYYDGWEKGETYYLLYGIFHRMDNNHPFDFEGFCIKVIGEKIQGIITVSHYMFLYQKGEVNLITIEAGSHGIAPGLCTTNSDHIIKPNAITFQPIFDREWDVLYVKVAPLFGNVKWPWQWNSCEGKYRIAQWGEHYLQDKLIGLIYKNPKLLFKIVEQWDTSKHDLLPELKAYLKELKNEA